MSIYVIASVAGCVLTMILGKFVLAELRKLKAGQEIRQDGPTWHNSKAGTPTMGGLMFIIGIGLTIVVLGWQRMMAGSFVHLYVYLFALVFGAIGYIDDYQKVKHHQNTGLTAPQKFILQLAAAVAFLCLMRYEGMLSPNLYIPFWNTHIVLPWIVYLVFAAFVIVGTVNAVNITDGLDGLSSSVTVPVGLFFLVMAVIWPGFEQLGLFSGALVGGLLGMKPDDPRLPDAFAEAEKAGLTYTIDEIKLRDAHPNTAVIEAKSADGRTLTMQASSIGGGRIMVNKLDGIDVNFIGMFNTLGIRNQDASGTVAAITSILSQLRVNVANMSLYRHKRGGDALMVIELDQHLKPSQVAFLSELPGVLSMTYYDKEEDDDGSGFDEGNI